MKIAICDSNKVFSNQLKHILYNYANSRRIDLLVEIFESGEALLKTENQYLLIFLEYSLSGIDGLKTAKILRKEHNDSKIIFISQNTDFVLEAFKVNPYRFLTKPLCQNTLYNELNDFFNNKNTHYPLWINDGNNTFCFSTNDISYIEANNKYCYIHLLDSVILAKKTMARVFEVLPKFHFQKINRAYIVNMNYINRYNNDYIFLKNGENLHITRTYYKIFKENFFEYLKPKII